MITLNPNFTAQFNQDKYEIIVSIYDTSIGQNSGIPVPLKILDTELISKLEIISDITDVYCPILYGSLIYNDVDNNLFNEIVAQPKLYCAISIKMANDPSNTSSSNEEDLSIVFDNQNFKHIFYIHDIQLISKSERSTHYQLDIISIDHFSFNNYISYSTTPNIEKKSSEKIQDKPVSDIINDLFVKSHLKLNSNYVKIPNKMFFITPCTSTLSDSLKYVLKESISSSGGFPFLAYNFHTSEYRLTSTTNLFTGFDSFSIVNIFNIPTTDSNPRVDANNITQKTYLSFNEKQDLQKAIINTGFNFDTRSWKSKGVSINDVSGILSSIWLRASGEKNSFLSQLGDIPDRFKLMTYNNLKEHIDTNIYETFKKLFFYYDVIEFHSIGSFSRKGGDMCLISVNRESPYFKKYAGPWLMTKVYHTFTQGVYSNIVVCSRTARMNDVIAT